MEDAEEIKKKITEGVYKLKRKQNGKSIIWNYFSEIEKDNDVILDERVYCEGCQKVFKYTKKQTSNLSKHKCVHSRQRVSSPVVAKTNYINDCFEDFLNFIIEDCRPFSIVEGSGFRKLIERCIKIGAKYGENVDLESLIPTAKAISERIKLIAEEKKQEIKTHIQNLLENGEAAVTIDLWTDNIIKRNFLCATLHFQFNFELVNITLGIKSMDFMSNTAFNIRDKLNSLFEEFGVTNMSNAVFVTDRRMNIKSALKDVTRLNCSVDLFSNILNDAFELTTELKEITESCNQIVKYFKKAKMQHLLKSSLKSHCPTRWNSNFVLFKSVFDNYGIVNKILADDTETRSMLNINMPLLQGLVEICNDFDIIFNKLQGTTSPTLCYVIPSINRIQLICTSKYIEEDGIAALKRNILLQLEKWRLNLSIWHKVAVFLYPPAITIQPNDIFDIKEFCMEKIIAEKQNDHSSNSAQAPGTPPDFKDFVLPLSPPLPNTSAALKNQNYLLDTSDPTQATQSDFNEFLLPQYLSTPSTSASQTSASDISFFFPNLVKNESQSIPENVRDEVERYANENVRLTDDFDVLLWWKNNSYKYPKLSKLAAKILSIPASSTSPERILSLAGNILTEKRNRLEPKTVDSILFLNSVSEKTMFKLDCNNEPYWE